MRLLGFMKRLLFIGLLTLIPISALSALAAANIVPITGLGSASKAVEANELKPSECAALDLTEFETVDGRITGNNGDSLFLGSPNADNVSAKQGDDCIVGGGGNDTLKGNQGNDVILGGPGNDDINGGNGYDICYGGPGTDTFTNCEVSYQ